jgi:hypothetical protein
MNAETLVSDRRDPRSASLTWDLTSIALCVKSGCSTLNLHRKFALCGPNSRIKCRRRARRCHPFRSARGRRTRVVARVCEPQVIATPAGLISHRQVIARITKINEYATSLRPGADATLKWTCGHHLKKHHKLCGASLKQPFFVYWQISSQNHDCVVSRRIIQRKMTLLQLPDHHPEHG